jgi:primosomal protein N' (replication factor Y)
MHTDPKMVNSAADVLAREIRKSFPEKLVLGPEYPMVSRIRAQYLKNIIVKIDRNTGIIRKKENLKNILDEFSINIKWKPVRIKINVDPA